MKDQNLKEYTDLNSIKKEVHDSKKLFKKNNWPVIDVTRRSVEETAASILKIIEIKKNK
jgi:regulator of PEP synthase PpsR (kinase-PPPase family)